MYGFYLLWANNSEKLFCQGFSCIFSIFMTNSKSKKMASLFKIALIALMPMIVVISCKKDKRKETSTEELQPVANFTTDKAGYEAGETIVLTSTSQNAGSCKWTLPDGSTKNGTSVNYVAPSVSNNLTLSFRLDVASPKGTKIDYAVKNVTVMKKYSGLPF